MSLTPSKVTWDPNRYKAHEWVITYDSNGNPSLSKKEADYTGVNYNFSSLPSGSTTQTQTSTSTQTNTNTQTQTAAAFGNVKPHYWNEGGDDRNNEIEQNITNFVAKKPDREDPQVSGFFKPLGDAVEGKKIGSLGERVKQKFEDITGKTERDWEDVDRDIEIDKITELLKTHGGSDIGKGMTAKAEAILRKRLNELLDSKRDTTIGSKIKKTPQVLGLGVRAGAKIIGGALDSLLGVTETDRRIQEINKNSLTALGYQTRGDLGSNVDPGRIAGNPADSVFAGMNMVSAKGNVMSGTRKRIDNINNSAAKARARGDIAKAERMEAKANKFEAQRQAALDKQAEQQAKINKETMNKGGPAGGAGNNSGGKSIICTQMYQQTQLEDWKKTMKLWYVFQKKYLTMEHQEGYHFLFKPFVNGMKKSKVLTALGKHCAIARTNDIKHIMFGTPFSLSGRLVRLVTEPICYITGKIKSWL